MFIKKAALLLFAFFAAVAANSQTAICPNSNTSFTSNISGSNYQWQVKTTGTYINISNDVHYAGASSAVLQITAAPSSWYGYQYRCVVDASISRRFTLSFASRWTGAVNSEWSNSANWTCAAVPDSNTDVFISPGTLNLPQLNSNLVCRTVNTSSGASVNINGSLTLTGRGGLPVEDIDDYDFSVLDSLPITSVPLNNIIMANGMNVKAYLQQNDPGFLSSFPSGTRTQTNTTTNTKEKQLDLFISRMIAVGSYLVYDANFPDQVNGLGYMPGGKQYLNAQHPSPQPPDPNAPGCLTDLFRGLDCSGMLYTITTGAYLPPVVSQGNFGVVNIAYTHKWDIAFKNSEYDSLGMFNMGKLPLNQIRLGDIIIWPNVSRHVGICLNNSIYQSYGRFSEPACQTNPTDPKKGPRILPLNQNWLNEFSSGNYIIFRPDFNTFTDPRDGQVYSIKQIDKHVWMTQNLNYAAAGSYCYENNPIYCGVYGRLYDWSTAKTVAPPGWKLPTDLDWLALTDTLGGINAAGGSMKQEGTGLWLTPNTAATNSSGFTALPGGNRNTFGTNFANLGIRAFWWTSTANTSTQAWNRTVDNASSTVGRGSANSEAGKTHFSVRLIRND